MIRRSICLLLLLPAMALAEAPKLRVAVFQGNGVGASSEKLIAAMDSEENGRFEIERITADEIRAGELSKFQVLVHPGGSGSKQGNSLGESGRDAIRQFVDSGGGFLGVCAGAYLATNDYQWSLHLIDAKVLDRKHWARGKGPVSLRLSPNAMSLFEHDSEEMSIYYAQGPLLARREWDDPAVPDYESLALFSTEIAKNGAPKGVMAGTSAAVRCNYGRGRVFCFSPHPELTEGLNHLIPIVVDWLGKK